MDASQEKTEVQVGRTAGVETASLTKDESKEKRSGYPGKKVKPAGGRAQKMMSWVRRLLNDHP